MPRLTTTAGPSRPAAASCCTTGTIVFICRLTTASTRMPFSSSSSAAPSITESPIAKIGFEGIVGGASVAGGGVAGTVAGTVVGVGTVVAACGTVLLVAGPGAGTVVPVVVGAPVVVVVVSSRSSMFVTEPAPWSSDWAISFCFSWAVARLATANTETATSAAPTPAITRRGAGSRADCRRRHHRPTWPRRIGVSMKRYDSSVTISDSTTAAISCATDRLRPATPRIIW